MLCIELTICTMTIILSEFERHDLSSLKSITDKLHVIRLIYLALLISEFRGKGKLGGHR